MRKKVKHNKRKKVVKAKKGKAISAKKFTIDICDEFQKLIDSDNEVAIDAYDSLVKEAKEKGYSRLNIMLSKDFKEVVSEVIGKTIEKTERVENGVRSDDITDLKWMAMFSDFPNNPKPEITPFYLIGEELRVSICDKFKALLYDKNASADVEFEKMHEFALKSDHTDFRIGHADDFTATYGLPKEFDEKWYAIMYTDGIGPAQLSPFNLTFDPSDMNEEEKQENVKKKIAQEIKEVTSQFEKNKMDDGAYIKIREYFDTELNEQTYAFDYYNNNDVKFQSLTREQNFEMSKTIF